MTSAINKFSDPDAVITECLTGPFPASFFLFAGAGSGKTRSLVAALKVVRANRRKEFNVNAQKVAVITYTNAACDEINRRLEYDGLFQIRTIHSFVWDLIKGFTANITEWLEANLKERICELEEKQRNGRSGKASSDRARRLDRDRKRLALLPSIRRYVYSSTGENQTRDSLNHAEVIKIGAAFLTEKTLMQQLLIRRFPILLIDESQDTNRTLIEALLSIQAAHREHFTLGLFGDTMQRIYSDGKVDLGINLPQDWKKPEKVLNYRCPRRIVELLNKVRSSVDSHVQLPNDTANDGNLRLFIADTKVAVRGEVEKAAAARMAQLTGDPGWADLNSVKTLTLEHKMAATRMGFADLFRELDKVRGFETPLREGTLPLLQFFSDLVLPLTDALKVADRFRIASLLRNVSPLLEKQNLRGSVCGNSDNLEMVRDAVAALGKLFAADRGPSFHEVLQIVHDSRLLRVPDVLTPFVRAQRGIDFEFLEDDFTRQEAIRAFLATDFAQIGPYSKYVSGRAPYGTHQGVKGLEFPRVLVILDDATAGGFMFKYEKLFGVDILTEAEQKKEQEGGETTIDRTRRLFYVTCSRCEKSLAILAYTGNTGALRDRALREEWFKADEIERV